MPGNYPVLVHEWLKKSAGERPDKTLIICGSQRITFRQLNEQSDNLASAFRRQGVSHQDRIIIFLDNSIEAVIALFAALKVGCVFIPLNGQLKAPKLSFILKDSQARFLISSGQKAHVVKEAVQEYTENLCLIFTRSNAAVQEQFNNCLAFETLIAQAADLSDLPPMDEIIDQDMAALIYTSGSTGEPKGVICTHMNMISAARSVIQYTQQSADDIILCILPMSFGYGLYQIIMSVMCGGTVIIEQSFTFFHQLLSKISEYKVTGFPLVPTVMAMMLNLQDLSQYDFSSLRFLTNAGAALPVGHIQRFRSLFPEVQIYSMYGLTECKRVSYLPPDQIDIRPDSVGKAMTNCRVFIVDENGNPVKPGEPGELVIQGSNVMSGYWQNPALSAQVYRNGELLHQRYLYSGDYFKQDEEGYLYFLGRKDDMIKTRGERVSPKEIENVLSQHPGVAEVAVIGIPEPVLGQAPKAFIVKSAHAAVLAEDILKYAMDNMERFMVPQAVEFIDALPKTPNGKVDKKVLKQQEKLQTGT